MHRELTEYEKMKENLPFDPADEALAARRTKIREMELLYNRTTRDESDRRAELLKEMLGTCGEDVMLLPNIHFDYGYNIKIGSHFFANVNSTFIDVAEIRIGNHVLIGPNVTLCTATHPILSKERLPQQLEDGREVMLEYSHPIEIEDEVWIGAGVIINPGVHIGRGTVIGSGSVVTKDIPANVVAAGVPCRVIREITEQDSLTIKGY